MRYLKSGQLVLCVISLTFLCSCVVSRTEGDQLQSDISRLKNEIAALQRDRSDFAIHADRKNSELSSRVAALENVTYRKAHSDTAESDRLKREVESLRSQLEETQRNIETVQDLPKAELPPDGKKEHFDWAKDAFDEESYDAALVRMDTFTEKYKDDGQYGAQAYLMKGDAAFILGKKAATEAARKDFYKKAVASYQDLLTKFPKSPRIPEGLFKVGETLETMGFKSDAKIFYEEIKLKHSKSSFAKQAAKKLQELSKKKKK